MVRALHHVTVVTREPDRVVSFLCNALDMTQTAELTFAREDIAPLLGWPSSGGDVRSTMLGNGDSGLIEVVDAPDAGRTERNHDVAAPVAGILQVSVVVRDIVDVLKRAERLEVDEIVGPRELILSRSRVSIAVVRLGGVQFQLSQSAPNDKE